MLKNERSHFESQVNRLQHKLKDLNDEFQLRLVTYLKNVAVSLSLTVGGWVSELVGVSVGGWVSDGLGFWCVWWVGEWLWFLCGGVGDGGWECGGWFVSNCN